MLAPYKLYVHTRGSHPLTSVISSGQTGRQAAVIYVTRFGKISLKVVKLFFNYHLL